jgi:hypothetical protein
MARQKRREITPEEMQAELAKLDWPLSGQGFAPQPLPAAQVYIAPEKACKPGCKPPDASAADSTLPQIGLARRLGSCSLTVLGGRPVSGYFAQIGPRGGRIVLSYTDWRILTGPIVYAWIDRRDVLYVGMSGCGFARLLSPKHHALQRAALEDIPRFFKPRPGMRLYVWPMKDAPSAAALEGKLIRRYRPLINRVGTKERPYAFSRPEPNDLPLSAANRRLREMGRP